MAAAIAGPAASTAPGALPVMRYVSTPAGGGTSDGRREDEGRPQGEQRDRRHRLDRGDLGCRGHSLSRRFRRTVITPILSFMRVLSRLLAASLVQQGGRCRL